MPAHASPGFGWGSIFRLGLVQTALGAMVVLATSTFNRVMVVELALPELLQTTGSLDWVVALPSGFGVQVVASGLEVQKTPSDLARFGDYGRILKAGDNVHLTKDLAPPGPVHLTLRYRQAVAAMERR